MTTRAAKTDGGPDRSVPEGDVPPLEQDLSILLPHLQQHVKQLGHRESVTLQMQIKHTG